MKYLVISFGIIIFILKELFELTDDKSISKDLPDEVTLKKSKRKRLNPIGVVVFLLALLVLLFNVYIEEQETINTKNNAILIQQKDSIKYVHATQLQDSILKLNQALLISEKVSKSKQEELNVLEFLTIPDTKIS